MENNEIIAGKSAAQTENTAQERAVYLHRQIMANGQLAADAFVEFCRGLKEMRDSKLYLELGFADFEGYTEQAVGLKQRQAYKYISTYEKLGETFLQSNANLGITKLELLASVGPVERQELAEGQNLQEVSTAELERLTQELRETKEQLTLFQNASDEMKTEYAVTAEKAETLEQQAEELRTRLNEESERREAAEVELAQARSGPKIQDEAELERIRADARKEALSFAEQEITEKVREEKEKARVAAEKKIAAAEAKMREAEEAAQKQAEAAAAEALERARREMQESLAGVETEKSTALQRARELEEKLKVAANPDTLKLNFYLEAMQQNYMQVSATLAQIGQADTAAADKFREAVKKVMLSLVDRL